MPAPLTELIASSSAFIDEDSKRLITIADTIHDNPELGSEEHMASNLLCDILDRGGFNVEREYLGMKTAFRATHRSGTGPKIAFIAEYDCLPQVGHGCGHNLIAASALGAGLAVSKVLDKVGGTIQVIGTPAEEGRGPYAGSKVIMVDKGTFSDVDSVIMMHPMDKWNLNATSLAVRNIQATFTGKAAHAAVSPDQGASALDAAVLTYVGLGMIRQHTKRQMNPIIHAIISEGGSAVNVIPDRAVVKYGVRANTISYVNEIAEKIRALAQNAASSTGTEVEFLELMPPYPDVILNQTLCNIVSSYLESLDVLVEESENPLERIFPRASTDFGAISRVVPAVSLRAKIAPRGTPWHSLAVAAAAKTPEAHMALLISSKVMAATAIRLLSEPSLIADAKREQTEKSNDRAQKVS